MRGEDRTGEVAAPRHVGRCAPSFHWDTTSCRASRPGRAGTSEPPRWDLQTRAQGLAIGWTGSQGLPEAAGCGWGAWPGPGPRHLGRAGPLSQAKLGSRAHSARIPFPSLSPPTSHPGGRGGFLTRKVPLEAAARGDSTFPFCLSHPSPRCPFPGLLHTPASPKGQASGR